MSFSKEQTQLQIQTERESGITVSNSVILHQTQLQIQTEREVGLNKLCQNNFANNRYVQEYKNNSEIIGNIILNIKSIMIQQ